MENQNQSSNQAHQTLSQRRTSNYYKQIQQGKSKETTLWRIYVQQISAILLTRAFVLGPIERMKIIMQVRPIAQFVNINDRPKNVLDLSNSNMKFVINQGIVAFYRGNNALIYKLLMQHGIKFYLYETLFQNLNQQTNSLSISSITAASLTALITTTLTYPLDLAHGRMAADMSKKPSLVVNKNSPIKHKTHKLYSSVRDCLSKTQEESGILKQRKYMNFLKGIQSALAAQIPYTMILMSCFEITQKYTDQQNLKFSRNDDYNFLYKFFTRFGASTLSLMIAQTICYPLDTIKRRMQLNGSLGHKNIYKNDWNCLQRIIKEEGYRGLYSGFSLNIVRCLPLALIQFSFMQNMRFITNNKQ